MSDWRERLKDLDIESLGGNTYSVEGVNNVVSPTTQPMNEVPQIKIEPIENKSLVDSIIEKGEDPNVPMVPEDKYKLPKQLTTIDSLRKKGFDNKRIFDAMEELERIEAEKEERKKNPVQGPQDPSIPKIEIQEDDDYLDRLIKPIKAQFLAGELKKTIGGVMQQLAVTQPGPRIGRGGRVIRDFSVEEATERTLNNPIFKTGVKLFESGMEDFASRPDLQPTDNFMDYEWSDPKFIASAVGQALPSFLTFIIPSTAVAVATRNPSAVFATTMATAYGMEAGSMYNEAIEAGLTPQEASNVASTVGVINSMISLIPAGGIFTRLGLGNKAIQDIMIKGAIRRQFAKNVGKKAFIGGFTEMLEEILQECTNILAETTQLGKEYTTEEIIKRLQAVAIGGGALGLGGGVGSGYVQTKTDVKQAIFEENKDEILAQRNQLQERLTVETQAQMINDDEANDFNIQYNKEDDGSREILESEIKARGYNPEQFPLIGENENGEKRYGVRVNGATDSKGNISLSNRATGSTILEEVIESRVKQLRNSKNVQERALADKIEIWAKSVRKKASEMGLELRFSEEGEGNLELFSDAILYTKGGFKGLDQKFEDAIYVPDDLANQFIGVIGEMSDGTKIFDALKASGPGIAPNQQFASGVDAEMQSQLYGPPKKQRSPPTAKIPKSKKSNQMVGGSVIQEKAKVTVEDANNPNGIDTYTTLSVDGGKIVIGQMEDKTRRPFIYEIEVDESKRRQGIGSSLLQQAINMFGVINGQASNDSAVEMNYKLGMRAYDKSGRELSLAETKKRRREDTSVQMISKVGDRNIDSPAFKKWFGNSVVQNDNRPVVMYHGSPYSFDKFATDEDGISWFSDNSELANVYARQRTQELQLSDYDGSAQIYPVYLKVENPLILTKDLNENISVEEFNDLTGVDVSKVTELQDSGDILAIWEFLAEPGVQNAIKKAGYDGVAGTESHRNKDFSMNQLMQGVLSEDSPISEQEVRKRLQSQYNKFATIAVFDNKQIKSVFNRGTFEENNANISYQLEPDVVEQAVNLYPDVMGDTGKSASKAERLQRFLGRLKTRKTKANPVQKDIPLEKMIGRPKNLTAVKVELKDGGVVYAGPKSAEQWLEQVNSILTEEEQIKASKWYEEAYPAFLEYFGEENAVPYMVGWLMGNVNASPQDALSNLYLGLEQLKAEFPSMKSAGLPGPAKNLKKLFAGERTEAGAGVKLYDFLDSALGKKTRTIMQDDPRAGSAVADDRHTNRDAGFVDATMYDELLKLAKDPSVLDNVIIDQKRTYKQQFDKNKKPIFNKDGTPKMKGSVAGPNETQYEWAVKSFNEMTKEINSTGYLGGDLAPAQIQAIGWTAIARALQTSEGMSIPDSFKNQEPTIAFELNFGKDTPYSKKFGDAYNELTLTEQQKLTDEIVKDIVPELAKDIGLDILKTSSNVIGAWKGDVSANQTIVVRGSNQAIKGMMNSLGLLLQQDSIGSIKMNSSFPGLGLAWYNPALADPNIAGIVYRILEQELDDKLVPGFFMENDFTGEGEGFNVKNEHAMIIGTDIKQSELIQFEDQLENAIERINDKLDIDMQFPVAFGQKYEATNNQWQKSTKGESYTDSIIEQFGKPLQKRLNDYYAPRVEKRLRERLLDKKRKQLKSYQIVPDFDLASEIDAIERIDQDRPLDITSESFSFKGIKMALRRGIIDSMDPVISLQEDIKSAYLGDAKLREHLDVALKAELSVGRIPELIKDFNSKSIDGQNANSFVSRLYNDLGMDVDEFSDYLYAKHAEVRNKHIKDKTDGEMEDGSGISSAEAKRIRSEINKKYGLKKLNKYVKEFRETFIEPEIELRYKAGLLSEQDYKNLTDPSVNPIAKNYVPLFREFDDEDVTVDSAVGQGFNVRGSEYKRAKGSKRKVRNVVVSSAERMHSAIIRSEKNKVNKTLLNLVESFPSTSYEVRGLSYSPQYDKDGEIKYLVPMEEGLRTEDGTAITKDNTINVKVDGKVKQIIFKGEQGYKIARAMKDMGVRRVHKYFTYFNTYLRYVNTIYNPKFIFSNFLRDLQTAKINISAEQGDAVMNQAISRKNISQAWKAVFNIARDNDVDSEWADLYNRMRLAGGKTGFFDFKSIEDKIAQMNKNLGKVDKTGKGVIAGGKAILNFIEDINEATESAIRLTLFKAMLDAGFSEAQSASGAKNVTINFNRKGEWGPILNSAYLFANAGIQGTRRIYTVVKNSKRARQAVRSLALAGMTESLINHFGDDIADNDDEYEKLSDFEKDNHFILRVGKEVYFKFRLPYGFNVFKVAGNIAGDAIWANMNEEAFSMTDASWRFVNASFNAFSPLGTGPLLQVLSPTFFDPFVQLSGNQNFYGAPIYPKDHKYLKADVLQTWETTPDAYKAGAEGLFKISGGSLRYDENGNPVDATRGPGVAGVWGDMSPETFEYFVDYLGGGLGTEVVNTVNAGISLVNRDMDLTLNNTPIVNLFFGNYKKDSEKRILYQMEAESKRHLFSPLERFKYQKYLDDYKKKGNISDKEFLKRMKTFDKNQEERIAIREEYKLIK